MRTQLFRPTFFLLICVWIPLTAKAQPVDIPDPNLRAVIEAALGKASGGIITVAEMDTLTSLEGNAASISDLTGLEFAINLTWLDLTNNFISDISPLIGLTNLEDLDLGHNSISDISPLMGLSSLMSLNLNYNAISDISPLADLTNLRSLSLMDNLISDISPLTGLTTLTRLSLEHNFISDISPLTELTNLSVLDLWDNSVSDISPLTRLTNLKRLYLGVNSISDISPLADLTNLRWLDLTDNLISDISALAGLIDLTELSLEHNSISDILPLAGLTNLERLWLYDNAISDVSVLVANTGLGAADIVGLRENALNYPSIETHIPALRARRVSVYFRHRTPTTIRTISGYQRGFPSVTLAPFVVEVRDEYGSVFEGVPVTFAVTAGDGTLSVLQTATDENGRAQSTLTLGQHLGAHIVSATAAGWFIDDPAIFKVISDTDPPPIATDVDRDGVVNILDLVLVASAFGSEGSDLGTDINGDGVVNILDLVWVADAFGAASTTP